MKEFLPKQTYEFIPLKNSNGTKSRLNSSGDWPSEDLTTGLFPVSNLRRSNISYLKKDYPDFKTLEKQFQQNPEDLKYDYNPFRLSQVNTCNPIYSLLFGNECDLDNICLTHKYHIKDLLTVEDLETKQLIHKNIFIKSAPLLDPIRYMIGKYNTEPNSLTFPSTHNLPHTDISVSNKKLVDRNNASYVDNFFCFLTNDLFCRHEFIHGIEYYGSFSGIQEKYKFDVSDDFDYLCNSTFFINNNRKLFIVDNEDINSFIHESRDTRTNKTKLKIIHSSTVSNNIEIPIEQIDESFTREETEEPSLKLEEIYIKNNESETIHGSISSNDSDSVLNYSTDNDDNDDDDDDHNETKDEESEDWETEEDTDNGSNDADMSNESETDKKEFSYINNFPVQLICIEKCEGTFDDLLENDDNFTPNEGICALFQIIMILITYQNSFHFTHNDLHTNNIMYISTDVEFLFYKYKNNYYKVPTYGKIYKIIDFGRAIYKYKKNLFCSDSFSHEGDAATQYNFEPYMNENKARIEPNYSFDLCRLGCSIFDFIIDDCDVDFSKLDDFQKIVYTWCQDDNGKNVLYKRTGEERYHNFKLYKMIARTVHQHTPDAQLDRPVIKQY
jgi:hypothetical protein